MLTSRRFLAATVAFLAVSMTVAGVIVAASDSNPAGLSYPLLKLHGHGEPPTSVNLTFAINTGQQFNVTGTLQADIAHNSLQGTVTIPSIFSTATFNFVEMNGTLYVKVPSILTTSTRLWKSIKISGGSPELFGYGIELADPKIDLFAFVNPHLGTPTTTHNGPLTTYTWIDHNVTLGSTVASAFPLEKTQPVQLAAFTLPRRFGVTLHVSTIDAGQVESASIEVQTGATTISVSAQIQSYNQRERIVAPPSSQVQPLTKRSIQALAGSPLGPILRLLLPKGLSALKKIHVR